MSFCIRGEGRVIETYTTDIDDALCGECEKRIVWDRMGTADCCGYRYARWVSSYSCHRVPAPPAKAEEAKPCEECGGRKKIMWSKYPDGFHTEEWTTPCPRCAPSPSEEKRS